MAMGAHATKILKKVRESGDMELTPNQLKFIEENYPEEYNTAYKAYEGRAVKPRVAKDTKGNTVTTVRKTPANKPTTSAGKKRGAGASSRTKKEPESISSIQRDATDIGEKAARAAGKGRTSKPTTRRSRRKKEPESISSIQRDATDIGEAAARDAIARGVYKRSGSVKGTGKGRGAGAKSSKPKSTKTTATTGKGLATTGSTTKRRGGGAKTQQQLATRGGSSASASKPASKVKGGAARKKRRMTRAEAAAAGAAVGVVAGVANQKNKTKTTNTTGTKSTPPKTPKGRSGNIGRTYMGDFATKAKVAAKPKKKYGESGMGMKAYQNMMFNRRK